jgi:hypothetical protein
VRDAHLLDAALPLCAKRRKIAALTEYFKDQARRVFGALRGFNPRDRLVEDCAKLVTARGGTWTGTATELHEQLVSDFKPNRPDELSKFLKDAAEDGVGLAYESDTERAKDENGEWKSRRILTLSVENGVTA